MSGIRSNRSPPTDLFEVGRKQVDSNADYHDTSFTIIGLQFMRIAFRGAASRIGASVTWSHFPAGEEDACKFLS